MKPPLQIHCAAADQQLALAEQFDSAQALRLWGGEGFSFPIRRQAFLQQLQLPDTESFVLSDDTGQMLAFGQVCDRFDRLHLARLLVLPQFRGQRLVEQLVKGLLLQGLRYWPRRDASLFVFCENHAAIRSYQRLGFAISSQPGPLRTDLHFMTLSNHLCRQLTADTFDKPE